MEKSNGDIKLTKRPMKMNSKSENYTDCGLLHSWTKGFGVVNAKLLTEAFSNKSRFVVCN